MEESVRTKTCQIRLAIPVEVRLVTDRQTDRQTQTRGHSIYRASTASRGKNQDAIVLKKAARRKSHRGVILTAPRPLRY